MGAGWPMHLGGILPYLDCDVLEATSESERQATIDWLYSYNLDDVRATFAVREYLRGPKF